MATQEATGLSSHLRGVTVTTLACLAGILAAAASAAVVGTSLDAARSQQPFFVLAIALFAQYPILRVIGVDIADFGLKDNLYVGFLTFTFWFISYGIILSANLA